MTRQCRVLCRQWVTRMDAEWLTYRELGEKLGVSLEAARRRALRGKWQKAPSNDGRTRVRVPDDWKPRPSVHDVRPAEPDNSALTSALESHIKTLQADNDALKQDLAAARADLAAEQARTTQAIAAFESLAQRLEAMAEARRPWWRRLVG
jgi:hypothetical protein